MEVMQLKIAQFIFVVYQINKLLLLKLLLSITFFFQRFCHGVNLLEKVVLQDNLSTLVVNLYTNNEGYSLMLKGKNGTGK